MSLKLRFTILGGFVIFLTLSALNSHAIAQPAYSPSQPGTAKGKFEQIFRKQTLIATPQTIAVEANAKNDTDANAGSSQEIQVKIATVVPLPKVEDENTGTSESDIFIDEKKETESDLLQDIDAKAKADPADEQPSVPDDQLENPTSDLWPGWLTDYRTACQKGNDEQKMLFVYFYDTNAHSPYKNFETESLVDEEVKKSLENYVLVRIPVTAKLTPTEDKGILQFPGTTDDQKELDETPKDAEEDVTVLVENVKQAGDKAVISQTIVRNPPSSTGRYTAMRPPSEPRDVSKSLPPGRDMGSVKQLDAPAFDLTFSNLEREIMLIRHPAFYEMLNTPGIAIIDFQHKDAEYYGTIVSVFPFLKKQPYTVEQTRAMLTLPPGTVTQRSVIFAVRIHPDKPKSTEGEVSPRLVEEARSASQYQADIGRQGHHNWDRRFQQINSILPTELLACEVCAESWPGQHLLESAIECVDCWRYSEGHWSAVSAEHPYYGYDMKLGPNGIWYGTGVFGKWRHPTLAKAGTLTGGQPQQMPKR